MNISVSRCLASIIHQPRVTPNHASENLASWSSPSLIYSYHILGNASVLIDHSSSSPASQFLHFISFHLSPHILPLLPESSSRTSIITSNWSPSTISGLSTSFDSFIQITPASTGTPIIFYSFWELYFNNYSSLELSLTLWPHHSLSKSNSLLL